MSKSTLVSYADVVGKQAKKVSPIVIKPITATKKGSITQAIKSKIDIAKMNVNVNSIRETSSAAVPLL